MSSNPAKEAYDAYRRSLDYEKGVIKGNPSKRKRFWLTLKLLVEWPWRWLWMACHDWRMVAIFVLWMAVVGCEVWMPFILGLLSPDPSFKAWMLSIAGTCEAFWLLPLTPFMPICIALTVGTKAVIDRISQRKQRP